MTLTADTNIFLRFLTGDIPKQAKAVEKRFKQAQAGQFKIEILHITIIEIVFQLENWYQLDKTEASDKLTQLLNPNWIVVKNKNTVLEALTLYKNHKIDFVDILTHTTSKKSDQKILSFDKDFTKLNPNLVLKP